MIPGEGNLMLPREKSAVPRRLGMVRAVWIRVH